MRAGSSGGGRMSVDAAAAARARGDAATQARALGRARCVDGSLRRRPDRDLRLPDLPRRRAASDPLADGGDRHRPLLRSRAAAGALPRPAPVARSGAASLGQIRARFYARIEPLAPAQLEGFRRGDLVSRMVGDVDALQGLYLRGIGPPAAAIAVAVVVVAVEAVILPSAGHHPRGRPRQRRRRSAARLPSGSRGRRETGRRWSEVR